MNKEDSLISVHPFVRGFVLSIVQTIRDRNFRHEDKFVINADFVPRGSDRIMMTSMKKSIAIPVVERTRSRAEFERRDMSELAKPIENNNPSFKGMKESIGSRKSLRPRPIVVPPVVKESNFVPENVPVASSGGAIGQNGKYGKLIPLLEDPSVSSIECAGKNKELTIIRVGQRQRTRIVLSADEIKEILNEVADEAHIPLVEGVFRASVKGFSISAVVSETIGSRFVIKKVTAYGLLE